MTQKRQKRWLKELPRISQTEVQVLVKHLASLLRVPETVFQGPVAKPEYSLDSLDLYREERLSIDYLSKYPGFGWGNPRQAAMESVLRSERECELTNKRVYWTWHRGFYDPGEDHSGFIIRVRKRIQRIIGKFDWALVCERGRWGPGVTSALKGTRLHGSEKFRTQPEVSPSFAKMGMSLVSSLPSWACLLADIDYPAWVTPLPKVVPGNRITFVPKNAKTDRSIAVEPHVNIFFQLGVGQLLRERLHRAGLDLDTQEVNQRLAALGSIDDTLSTIDLERASDTLSWRVVEALLPDDWFAALNACRSQFGLHTWDTGFTWRPYEKFSSMGNGFTFELESLIFWALCSEVADEHGYNSFWCTSYGDDIVVPSGIYDEVVKVLNWFGFTVNHEKSFRSGPFRESCGKDFLRGSLVRPVYLKEIPDNPLSWIKIANNLKRLAHTWAGFQGLDKRLRPAYEFAVSVIPAHFRRLSVSDGYGDVALIRDFDEAKPVRASTKPEMRGWEGWIAHVLLSRAVTYESTDRAVLTAGTHNPGRLGNSLPYRDTVEWTIGPMYVSTWRNLGTWTKN